MLEFSGRVETVELCDATDVQTVLPRDLMQVFAAPYLVGLRTNLSDVNLVSADTRDEFIRGNWSLWR
jgi:hypothetical protein